MNLLSELYRETFNSLTQLNCNYATHLFNIATALNRFVLISKHPHFNKYVFIKDDSLVYLETLNTKLYTMLGSGLELDMSIEDICLNFAYEDDDLTKLSLSEVYEFAISENPLE